MVLYSASGSPADNYSRYYDVTKKTYEALVNNLGVDPNNIYVFFGDGIDPAADQNAGTASSPQLVNSDMSFAANVLPATPTGLLSFLGQLPVTATTTSSSGRTIRRSPATANWRVACRLSVDVQGTAPMSSPTATAAPRSIR